MASSLLDSQKPIFIRAKREGYLPMKKTEIFIEFLDFVFNALCLRVPLLC